MSKIVNSELIVKQSEKDYEKTIAEVSEKDPTPEEAKAILERHEIKNDRRRNS